MGIEMGPGGLRVSDFDMPLPDDFKLFGDPDGLVIKPLPPNERPPEIRSVIDRDDYYDSGSIARCPANGKWGEIAFPPNSSGETCMLSFRDFPSTRGTVVRYQLVFFNNKHPNHGNNGGEEVDIDVIVLNKGFARYNKSMRLTLPYGYDHIDLLSRAGGYCQRLMKRMPEYFGFRGL